MTITNSSPASAAFGVRLRFVLQFKRTLETHIIECAGNIAGEASGNKIT
jgi:hypothetical protein